MKSYKIYKTFIPVKWKPLGLKRASKANRIGLIAVSVITLAGIVLSVIKNIRLNKDEQLMLNEILRLISCGEMKRAKLLCDRAVKTFSSVQARYLKGVILLDEKNYEAAKASFESAFKLSPETGEFLAGVGVAEYFMGDLDESLITLKTARAMMNESSFDEYLASSGLQRLKPYLEKETFAEAFVTN